MWKNENTVFEWIWIFTGYWFYYNLKNVFLQQNDLELTKKVYFGGGWLEWSTVEWCGSKVCCKQSEEIPHHYNTPVPANWTEYWSDTTTAAATNSG